MIGHPPTERALPYARFRHGTFECTVVTDGILEMGPARTNFPDADPAEVDALLEHNYLSSEEVHLDDNILVVDTGDYLIQFDSGVGVDPHLGRDLFGWKTGQTILNLRAAGIDPAEIDYVALTHTHPDHAWGLVDADGVPLYPNARVAVGREDYELWMNPDRGPTVADHHRADYFAGIRKNLAPYEETGRIDLLDDGTEVIPGVTAIATPGHSPGHRVYRIDSGADTMICWGDLCHHPVILLQRPDWGFQFDYDRASATAQRRRIYDLVESNRFRVLAYHFPFPGLGNIKKDGIGYSWVPAELERQLPPETIALLTEQK